MGLVEDITEKIRTSDVIGAVAAEFFPETLAAFLNEYLDYDAKEFYHKVKEIEGRSLLGYLDPGSQAKLRGMVPEELDWLDIEWFVKAIAAEHPDIVSLILSSNYVRKEIERQINSFQAECAR